MSLRVLHVDGKEMWRDTVKMVLRSDFEVISFASLSTAQMATRQEHFDYFVCENHILVEDGGAWAVELQRDGRKVVMLSSEGRDGIAFVPKRSFSKEALLEALGSLCRAEPHARLRSAIEQRLRAGISKSAIRREIGASWNLMEAIDHFMHADADDE